MASNGSPESPPRDRMRHSRDGTAGCRGAPPRGRDDALIALEPRITAGAPWPMAEVFGAEPEANWGPPELLAHVAEFLPYWLGEIERILEGAPRARAVWPRPDRQASGSELIGRERTLPLRELFSRIQSDSDRVARRLRELTDAEASGPSRSSPPTRRRCWRCRNLLEPFLAGHLEGHVTQLREILTAAGV